MTTTTTTMHDDTTVRTETLWGIDTVVADDPDTTDDYCLSCERVVTPMIAIVIIDNEQWDAADDAQSMCPMCGSTDLTREAYADTILTERAADDDADRRYHEWKDEGGR